LTRTREEAGRRTPRRAQGSSNGRRSRARRPRAARRTALIAWRRPESSSCADPLWDPASQVALDEGEDVVEAARRELAGECVLLARMIRAEEREPAVEVVGEAVPERVGLPRRQAAERAKHGDEAVLRHPAQGEHGA